MSMHQFLLFLLKTRPVVHSSLIPLSSHSPLPFCQSLCLNFHQIFTVSHSPCNSWLLCTAHALCVIVGHFGSPGVKTTGERRKVSAQTWHDQRVGKVLPSEWCGWSREKSNCWDRVPGAPRSHLAQDTGKLPHLEEESHCIQCSLMHFALGTPSHRLNFTMTDTSHKAWELISAQNLVKTLSCHPSVPISCHLHV